MAEWDDENFEPAALKTGTSNKWEGEDEEEDVKDNWEDEDEEKKEDESPPETIDVKPVAKKKSLSEKIAEKERLKKEEYERRLKEQQEEDEITLQERIRLQKESDLKAALETTFGDENTNSGIESMNPVTKEEFKELSDALSKKIQVFSKSEEYPTFAENLIREVCVPMSSFDLKKIKTTIDNLYLEKQKIEKGDKLKKSKGKGKAKLRLEGDNLNQYSAYVDDFDEYDDFM